MSPALPEDHWYARLLREETYVDDDGLVRIKPQTFKRLRLRKRLRDIEDSK